MRSILVGIILIALAGCGTADRYEYKINLPDDICTQPVDPNDGAYVGLVHMNPTWKKTYGDSHWSLELYNWAVMRDRVERLEKAVLGIEKTIEETKGHNHDIKKE